MARINTVNYGVTELESAVTASDTSFPLDNSHSVASPTLIVIAPRDAAKREVILCDGTFSGDTVVTTNVSNRGLAGSASGAQAHDAETEVWISPPLAQLLDEVWDDIEALDSGKAADPHDSAAHSDDYAADPHSNTEHSTNLVGETGVIAAMTEKASPHDDDLLVIEDSEASNAAKKVKISSVGSEGAAVLAESTTTADVTNTTDETALIDQAVAALAPGEMLRLRAVGDYLNNSGSSRSINIKVRIGSTDAMSGSYSSMTNSESRRMWSLDVVLFAESTSAQRVGGSFLIGGTVGGSSPSWPQTNLQTAVGYGVAAEDTTSSKNFQFRVAHSGAHASLDIRVQAWKLERVNAA